MKISAGTDVGMMRQSNQDSFETGEFRDGAWAVVCDGMGGHAGGNIASKLAVDRIAGSIKENYREGMSSSSVRNILESAIAGANADIFDYMQKDEQLYGMGTTVVAAVCIKSRVVIAHVGDSRCYYISDGQITQVTTDHSLVQEMVAAGLITASEAENHPHKNIITRALGGNENDVEVDFCELEISENEMLLLCSDGLTNHVKEEEIQECLSGDDFENYSARLIDLANDNGGSDNITAVVMRS